jgi:hypothetical protein
MPHHGTSAVASSRRADVDISRPGSEQARFDVQLSAIGCPCFEVHSSKKVESRSAQAEVMRAKKYIDRLGHRGALGQQASLDTDLAVGLAIDHEEADRREFDVAKIEPSSYECYTAFGDFRIPTLDNHVSIEHQVALRLGTSLCEFFSID